VGRKVAGGERTGRPILHGPYLRQGGLIAYSRSRPPETLHGRRRPRLPRSGRSAPRRATLGERKHRRAFGIQNLTGYLFDGAIASRGPAGAMSGLRWGASVRGILTKAGRRSSHPSITLGLCARVSGRAQRVGAGSSSQASTYSAAKTPANGTPRGTRWCRSVFDTPPARLCILGCSSHWLLGRGGIITLRTWDSCHIT